MKKFKKILDDPQIFYSKQGSVWQASNNKYYWSFYDSSINGPAKNQQSAMNNVLNNIRCKCPNPDPFDEEDKLKCPKCGKKCSSTSGLTLHIKNCKSKPKSKPKSKSDSLKCPKCGKKCSSTSGLTLHTKNCSK